MANKRDKGVEKGGMGQRGLEALCEEQGSMTYECIIWSSFVFSETQWQSLTSRVNGGGADSPSPRRIFLRY